jgi:hypothetical protein
MDDDFDGILSSEQDVVPRSAFVGNVMAAVRREALTPAPIPFPWWRIAPGLAICAIALTTFLVVAVIQFHEGEGVAGTLPRVIVNVVENANSIGLRWIVLALVASFVPSRLVLARA